MPRRRLETATITANRVSTAMATIENLKIIQKEKLIQRSTKMGEILISGL